ncbi:hypothetical protein G6F32_015380 [Rhizopus arrhizus]|nr:hypothetical protein G6F32_015380 [Rhizopus arrhizus]
MLPVTHGVVHTRKQIMAYSVVLALVCLLQFASSLIIDRRYETQIGRNYFWVICAPPGPALTGESDERTTPIQPLRLADDPQAAPPAALPAHGLGLRHPGILGLLLLPVGAAGNPAVVADWRPAGVAAAV